MRSIAIDIARSEVCVLETMTSRAKTAESIVNQFGVIRRAWPKKPSSLLDGDSDLP